MIGALVHLTYVILTTLPRPLPLLASKRLGLLEAGV
jgi:hypothetical protein